MEKSKDLIIYQAENGAIALKSDANKETVWASLNQIAELFGRDKSVISRHIKNILKDEELTKDSVVAKNATTALDGKTYQVDFYNLDLIISVGYRVNSKVATHFRKWSTQVLKQHITQGYTTNQKVLAHNKQQFLKTLNDLKILTHENTRVEAKDILSLIESFSNTFFTLENFDKNNFPKKGEISEVKASAEDLKNDIQLLKAELIKKGEATKLFAQEKKQDSLEGIYGNVFQSVFGQDAYPSTEEKAAHLLYFIVKNHPFNDGNKRSGAFAFIWLLQKANYNFIHKISPETLTALTLLIATSDPNEKDKMIGLILLLLNTTT